MITTNIDTTWLNQGSILLIHRSYHVVGVICGLYLNISNYNEGSISAACSGPDLFLPEKSRLDTRAINRTCTFNIISKFNLNYVHVTRCRNRKCQQTQNTIHVVIFLPFVAFVFTYNSTATRTDLR